jgi:hypothetical protein
LRNHGCNGATSVIPGVSRTVIAAPGPGVGGPLEPPEVGEGAVGAGVPTNVPPAGMVKLNGVMTGNPEMVAWAPMVRYFRSAETVGVMLVCVPLETVETCAEYAVAPALKNGGLTD